MNKLMLESLVGKLIKVDRHGPESRFGKLLAVEEDYFVLLTKEDGVIYYKDHHVRSLTIKTRKDPEFDLDVPRGVTFVKGKNFEELLENLQYQWVKINRGGEKIEGVLETVGEEFATVIHNEEIIRLSLFHIRNISYGLLAQEEQKEEKNDKKDNKK